MGICFLSVLALRRNEFVGLKWSDIDFESSSANIFQKGGSLAFTSSHKRSKTSQRIQRYVWGKLCINF